MTEDQRRIAQRSPLFGGASPSASEKLLRAARLREYRRGDIIFSQGEPARAIGLVIEGWVKLFRVAPNGTEAVVRVFSSGESFGEAVALRGVSYPVSAAAVTDCKLLWLDAVRLLALIRDDPEIAVSILTSTFVHLHELVTQIEQLKAQNGGQRVARFLVGLCDRPEGGAVVTLPYDKMLIAAELGLQPESLSRAFARLRDVGVTIRHNQVEIADVAGLRAYATDDRTVASTRPA